MNEFEEEYPKDESLTEDESRLSEMDEMMSEEEEQRRQENLRIQIEAFGQKLDQIARNAVKDRKDIEDRWIEDLRQYNGMYDHQTWTKLKNGKGSRLFVNLTRPKCNTAEAKLADMLFPTDEKNWGIKPTPVPELSKVAQAIGDMAPETPVDMTPEGAPVLAADMKSGLDEVMEEAKKRAQAMETEIDDQLEEADYTIKARQAIHDAIIYGTAVLKGPVIVGRCRKRWAKKDGVQVLEIEEDLSPAVENVDIWDFFPDMSARNTKDCEHFLQRHYMTRRQLADLRKVPGFDEEAIDELLKNKPGTPMADYREQLRDMAGVSGVKDNRYEVWEYHGAVDFDDMQAMVPDITATEAAELEAVVFFCEGKVLKAMINPLETSERPYSVYVWERDDSSIFGFGVPYLYRAAQKSGNASFRMMMDNGGLSTGPQIAVNTAVVQPADGSWSLGPRKVWKVTDRSTDVRQAMATFEINSHLPELANLFTLSREIGDELVGLPLISQGEQAPHLTQTAKGTSILMNAANVVMRRAVKAWDDCVTKELIKRFYDWNMQYSQKDEIKGDMNILARGTSAMLERESQTEKLLGLLQVAPSMGGLMKIPQIGKKLVQSMNLPAEELVMTDEEIKQAQQNQPQQPDLETMKVQVMQQKVEMEAQNNQMDFQIEQNRQALAGQKMQLDAQDRMERIQLELEKLAQNEGITAEQLRTELGIKQMDIQSKERQLAAELQAKATFGSGI